MRFAGWFGISVGLLMIASWMGFFATGQVPEVQTEPVRLGFHLAGELLTAIGMAVGGAAVLLRVRRAAGIYLPAAGMLLYSVIVSPGYFAQQGKWPPVAMFVVLLVLTLISMAAVMRSEGS